MGGTPGADTGFPEGGGGWRHSQAPPLGHCPRDVINLKNASSLGHSQAPPPPWTLPVWRHPHSKGGGGGGGWCDRSVPVTHTLHRFSVSGQVQGGGGVIIPGSPLDPPLNTIIYRVWLGCLYHGRNKESSSNRRGWLISHSGAYFHLYLLGIVTLKGIATWFPLTGLDWSRFCCQILAYLGTFHLIYGTRCLLYWFC